MIDIILPTYNNLGELKACLDGFSRQTMPDFRILCCVDGSTDGTIEYLDEERFPFPLKIITHPDGKRHGSGPTRNLALNHLQSGFLIFVDSDLIPSSDLVLNHISLLRKKDCISLGSIHYSNSNSVILTDYIQSRSNLKRHPGDIIPIKYFNTQNIAIRTHYFSHCKGQDPAMSSYGGDDIELGIRLHKTYGLRIHNNPSAFAVGEVNKTLDQVLNKMEEFGAGNLKVLRKKHPEYDDIFQVRRLESSRILDRLIRSLLQPWIASWVRASIEKAPKLLRRKMIQYLMFYHLALGYLDKKGERS